MPAAPPVAASRPLEPYGSLPDWVPVIPEVAAEAALAESDVDVSSLGKAPGICDAVTRLASRIQ